MNHKVNFRRVIDKDISKIQNLFKITFKKNITKKYYFWQYKNKKNFNSFVAYKDKKVVGHIGFVNKKILFNKNLFLCIYRHTTMIHPDYRKLGIYKNLMLYSYNILKNEKYLFILGWPNEINLLASKKQKNFNFIKKISTFTLEKKTGKKINKIFLKKNFNSINKLDKKTFSKFSIIDINNGWSIYKDYEYIKHRYIKNPDSKNYFYYSDSSNGENILIIFRYFNQKKTYINIVEIFSLYKNNTNFFINKFLNYKYVIQVWEYKTYKYLIDNKFKLIKPNFNISYYPLNFKNLKSNKKIMNKYLFSMGDIDVF
tara:strand:- start:6725 stop:7663 length:939 start_codon:yes stop_codon:yes gene_type:complete